MKSKSVDGIRRIQKKSKKNDDNFYRIHSTVLTYILIVLGVILFVSQIARIPRTMHYEFDRGDRYIQPEVETIYAEVTAYSSSEDETDSEPLVMASGDIVYDGAVACPARYEMGTRIIIQGKTYTCLDRMHKRYRDGNYFDIWVTSKEEAFEFGRQQLIIHVYA